MTCDDWEYDQFADEYDPETDCYRCHGSGEVPTEGHEAYFGDNYKPCPTCGGSGKR